MQKFTEKLLVESTGDRWVLKRAFKFYYIDMFNDGNLQPNLVKFISYVSK